MVKYLKVLLMRTMRTVDKNVNEHAEEGFQEVRASNQAKAIDLSSSGPDPSEPIAFAPFAGGTNTCS